MRYLSRQWLRANPAFPTILLVGIVYACTLGILEKRGFWVADNANKFLQLQAIVENNYFDYSIPWPGRAMDPDFTFNPLTLQFSKVHEGRLYSVFAPFFATVSSFFFRAFGFWGLYILPALFSLVMLGGLARLARIVSPRPAAVVVTILISGLCTPVWFYSVIFWEHTIAACFCVWAVVGYLRYLRGGSLRNLVVGSAALALGVYFRDELYIFCAVLVVAAVISAAGKRVKTGLSAAVTLLICLIPLWLFQWMAIGHPLGFHLGSAVMYTTGVVDYLKQRPEVFYSLFVAFHPSVALSFVLAAPFLIVFLLRPQLGHRTLSWFAPVLALAALVSTVISLQGYLSSVSPLVWMLQTNSLFAVSPVLVLAFLRRRDNGSSNESFAPYRWICWVALAYGVLYGMAAHRIGSQGVHWGNRFLFVLYPLFGVLAGSTLVDIAGLSAKRIDWRKLTIGLVISVSLAAQVYSIVLLHEKKKFSYRLNEELRTHTEPIVLTNVWWAPQALFSQFYDKMFFVAVTSEEFESLRRELHAYGYRRCLLVTQPSEDDDARGATSVIDERMRDLSLSFMPGKIRAPDR